MTHIGHTLSLPAPAPARSRRERRFTRRLAHLLAPAFVVAVLGCREDAESPTAPEPGPALTTGTAHVLSFRRVSAGGVHTCGVTSDNLAYCWGTNFSGQLGDGTLTQSLGPVAVAGGLRFRQVSAGANHSCGVTTDNLVYCWGDNQFGELGIGTTETHRPRPVAVVGGLQFHQVSAGGLRTCGVTTSDQAYCWGQGHVGDGTNTSENRTPVAVAGGLEFRQVSAGTHHSCGVTTADRAYCWGINGAGELGDGTTALFRLSPVAVVGGLRFRQVAAGADGSHTCGVTTTNRAYCWGANFRGQLGDGTSADRRRPVPVAGDRRFLRVTAGQFFTCAVNRFHVAFCWGDNSRGQLGDNTTTQRLIPVRVARGLPFRQVSPGGGRQTCGVTTDNLAYCWGDNSFGQLGDGTLISRRRPTPVAGAV